MWSSLKSALCNLLRKQHVESDLDEEIQSYVDAVIEEKIAAGLARAEARRGALTESGGIEQMKQAVRNGRAGTLAESPAQDVRYGLRQLRCNPAFTLTAVITLGLGIGATTAIFSAVYALLLRPLSYRDPDRPMFIYEHTKQEDSALANQDFFAAQSALRSFESVAGYSTMAMKI